MAIFVGQNDYYGSNYASLPLRHFSKWVRNESSSPRNFGDAADFGETETTTDTDPSEIMSAHKVLPMKSSFWCDLVEEAFADEETREQLLGKSSSFSIDINPRLLLASEDLVEVLITSGVGRYLEFAAIENTYVMLSKTDSVDKDAVWEVPCSKKDVFLSKLLGMVEKRQLMKFLQFVADYGETHILHEDVTTKNERSLALGRALKRPQNKASSAASDDISVYLDGPFQTLLEKHFKLSPKLQQVVVYCVALASFPLEKDQQNTAAHQQMTARDGLAAVYRYVSSIGRFTGTAFLLPLYGISEIAQSFCRLCAVYGGIYVLRAPIDGFVVDSASNNVVGIRCTDGGMVRAKEAVVVNGSYLECFTNESNDNANVSRRAKVLRGVFLLKKSLRYSKSRIILAIPPNDPKLHNPYAVQVVQADFGAYVCPRDFFLVHVSMPLPSEWKNDHEKQRTFVRTVMEEAITSMLFQDGVPKKHDEAEANAGSQNHSSAPDEIAEAVGAAAVEATSESAVPTSDTPQSPFATLVAWHTIFTVDALTAGAASVLSPEVDTSIEIEGAANHFGLPRNVWVCETSSSDYSSQSSPQPIAVHALETHLENASANARAIFERLCPGEDFLPKSASAEQAEQEELEGEENAVLEAAQKLAESTSLSPPTGDSISTKDDTSNDSDAEQ